MATGHPESVLKLPRMVTKHLHLFGGVWLSGSESKIQNFGTTRSAKLLVLLCLTRSGKMLRSQLAEQLWPDDYFDATRLRLRQEIHRLKRALGVDADLIGSDSNEVWVDRSALTTDLELLEDIRKGHDRLVPESVFVDEFLPGWHDDWVVAERTRAKQIQVASAIAASSRRLESGDATGALALAKRMIQEHPLNEELRMVAVHSNAKLGSLAASVAEYQDYRRKVRDQLGIETIEPDTNFLTNLAQPAPEPRVRDWTDTIPTALDPIVGRDSLIAETLAKLQRQGTRLITLVGPGGIGKTQLAIEIASRLRDAKEQRVAYISLAEVSDGTDWARTALSQLRSEPPSETDPTRYLTSILNENPTILVLDNLESVLPQAVPAIKGLLRQAPNVRILATSVLPVRVEGETLVPVAPLDPATSGLELLESVVQSLRPQLLTHPETRAELAEIVSRLDGYPLAIRLAAGRLRLLSPRALLDQLHNLLGSPARGDLADRHRSLDLALGSALTSLTPGQRSFIEGLSVYPAGITMELVEKEFGDSPYLETIEELLDLALLNLEDHQTQVRLRVLSPVRHYIQSLLPPSELFERQQRAARNVLSFVGGLAIAPWAPLGLHQLQTLDTESANIAFAFRWACEHEPELALRSLPPVLRYEVARGNASGMVPLLEGLREHWRNADPVMAGHMELCQACLKFAFHEEAAAKPFLDQAQEYATIAQDPALLARVDYGLSLYAYRIELARALEISTRALDSATRAGDRYLQSCALKNLALIATTHHQKERTVELLWKSYNGFLATKADSEAASTGIYLAHQLWHVGQPTEAAAILDTCRRTLEEARQPASLAYLHEIEGRFAIDEGRPADAEIKFRAALRIWSTIGSAFQEADQNHSLTRSLIDQGRWEEAKATLVAAGDLWFEDQNKGGLCCTLTYAASVALNLGNEAKAKELLAFSLAFEKEHALLLMQGEIDFRARLVQQLGQVEPSTSETSLDLGHAMLAWFR